MIIKYPKADHLYSVAVSANQRATCSGICRKIGKQYVYPDDILTSLLK